MHNEKSLENSVIKWAKKHGVDCERTFSNSRGWPDVMFWRNGKVCFIEFKNPNGKGKVHPLQQEMLDRFENNKVPVIVSHNFKESIDFLVKQFGDIL